MLLYIIAIVTAILIARLAHSATEMRNPQLSAYIFAALYLLSLLVFLSLFFNLHSSIITLLILLSYFPLTSADNSFSSSTTDGNAVSSLLAFLALGTSSILSTTALWLIPAYIVAQVMLRSLTPKAIVAALLGILVPWLWKWGVGELVNSYQLTVNNESAISPQSSFLIPSIILFIIYIIGVWHFNKKMYFDKSRTRVVWQVIMFFGIYTFLLLFISLFNLHSSSFILQFSIWYTIALVNTTLLTSRMISTML